MTQYCVCCGKKIGFYDKKYNLVNVNVVFCSQCGKEAKDMLAAVKINCDEQKMDEIKNDFLKKLAESSYSKSIKDSIKAEFRIIFNDSPASKKNCPKSEIRYFRSSYDEAFEIVADIGEKIADRVCDPLTTEIEGVRFAVFTFEKYYMRTGSYASLTVSLAGTEDITAVTVIGSGGGDGIFNMSYGAEEDFVSAFWEQAIIGYNHWLDKETTYTGDAKCPGESGTKETVSNRTGVLGGSFDPVHNGHVALGRAAIKEANLDRLIVMPARVQPFKQGKRVTEDYHRQAMAELAFSGMENTVVSDYELNNMKISYTYDTLVYLQKKYPDERLYFVLGTDSMLQVEQWYKGTDILENFSFAVSVRPGYKEEELESCISELRRKYGTEIIKICSNMPDVSSTEVRRKIAAGESVEEMVPEPVERYIEKNGLYR